MADGTSDEGGAGTAEPLTASMLPDPLPRGYVTEAHGAGGAGVGGRIKVRPEDFLVDELPLYEPSGRGEHVYLGIEKNRVSHGELVATLSRRFHVRPDAVGFAGMKDKHGVTRQTVSIHLIDDPPSTDLGHERIKVLWASRHRNKLRRGHLRGNRFSIRIRDVEPTKAPLVAQQLRRLEAVGVPCSFGPQRFGYRRNNHLIGRSLVLQRWVEALDELLGSGGSTFPEYQRERRLLYDDGRFDEAAALWTPADRAELIAIKALAKGQPPMKACRAVGRTTFSFWISALQSAMFNHVLEQRLERGDLAWIEEGDVMWKHANGRVFTLTADEVDDPEIHRRLEAFEISPTGPLWGDEMIEPRGATRALEEEALRAYGFTRETFLGSPRVPNGARRPLRASLRNVEVDGGVDEHGGYIRTAFDLPPGTYATVVLREVMRNG